MRRISRSIGVAYVSLSAACGRPQGSGADDTDATAESSGDEAEGEGESDDEGAKFDIPNDFGGGGEKCKVGDEMDAPAPCEMKAPPDSFEPEIQWEWTNQPEPFSWVTPLVANFTDDNDDGEIDLCDVPDVLVVVTGYGGGVWGDPGHLVLLDGETGSPHLQIDDPVEAQFTPAIGDIDHDGHVEIVAITPESNVVAFEHDGAKIWETPVNWGIGEQDQPMYYSNSAALADLDNDGDVEIVTGHFVLDHEGNLLETLPTVSGQWGATAAADLDGDDDLEVVLGNAAYHHDGQPLWVSGLEAGYPQIADLDADGAPEVLLTNQNGISLLEADGTVVYQDLRPTGDPIGYTTWLRPATIHDFDGDGLPEYATSSADHYAVYETDASIVWSAPVFEPSGVAAGTAFDFLGDGVAQAMYADQQFMYVYDGDGTVLLQISRKSNTLTEYPTVSDIDNDGSAEILVVSNNFVGGEDATVKAIRDVEDRWIQARRIWNQHTYHVTNVREDGTIPQFEPPSWETVNTFRTNAQIEDGGVCIPPAG